ncbi:Uncharacterized protein Fot_24904 [Forsythia ovata]|uniref:Uncharacterized protein n=1 Tax=Forsythia ovata TaxID=205694 RepID=A0ABD1U7H7_9LAMI
MATDSKGYSTGSKATLRRRWPSFQTCSWYGPTTLRLNLEFGARMPSETEHKFLEHQHNQMALKNDLPMCTQIDATVVKLNLRIRLKRCTKNMRKQFLNKEIVQEMEDLKLKGNIKNEKTEHQLRRGKMLERSMKSELNCTTKDMDHKELTQRIEETRRRARSSGHQNATYECLIKCLA